MNPSIHSLENRGYAPGTECAICKGRCCKEKGCSLSPEDLSRALCGKEISRENLLALLQKKDGLYAIDCHTDEEGIIFYLRMRHKCYTFIGVDAIGECVALTPTGCALSNEERPKGGRFLRSSKDFRCVQTYTAAMMRADWLLYQAVLRSIWQEYEAKFYADGTFDACDEAYFVYMREQREKG